jgi:hypothetical protein
MDVDVESEGLLTPILHLNSVVRAKSVERKSVTRRNPSLRKSVNTDTLFDARDTNDGSVEVSETAPTLDLPDNNRCHRPRVRTVEFRLEIRTESYPRQQPCGSYMA